MTSQLHFFSLSQSYCSTNNDFRLPTGQNHNAKENMIKPHYISKALYL